MTSASSSAQRLIPSPAPVGSNGHRAPGGPGVGHGTALPTRHHPKGYVALAVALIVTCAALGFWFYSRAGEKVTVVVAARDIPVGQTISRADLSTVQVAGGVVAVGAAHLDSLVGQVATVEILPNTLVQRAMVAAAAPLSASEAVVGVAVSAGQFPSSGLRPGDHVQVIGLAQKGAVSGPGAESSVLARDVLVADVRANPALAGGMLVSLTVPATATVPIASASNQGLVALVRVGGGS